MDNIINSEYERYEKYIVTPITPYLICQHYFSDEIYHDSYKYIDVDIEPLFSNSPNDLSRNRNFDKIKEGDIVQVQVDVFDHFMNDILPQINTKIILITSQWQLPQLQRSQTTDLCLKNNKIILWISQNPIYKNHDKYMAFPYGIDHRNVNSYVDYIKKHKDLILNSTNNSIKSSNVYNSNIVLHPHLPTNHIRRHPIFQSSCVKIPYKEYLDNILKHKFVISTGGDRDDCYRHYECIGMNSIPVSNIDYTEIFEDNMIYFDIDNIIKTITGEITLDYHNVNRDILTIEYWVNKIQDRVLQAKILDNI